MKKFDWIIKIDGDGMRDANPAIGDAIVVKLKDWLEGHGTILNYRFAEMPECRHLKVPVRRYVTLASNDAVALGLAVGGITITKATW